MEDQKLVIETPNRTSITSTPSDEVLNFPDGGFRAWLVVLGSYLTCFSTWGFVNSYGVFSEYYSTTLLSHSSSSTISLIGALQLFFMYGASPIVGKVFDFYGIKALYVLGSGTNFFSLMMLSICKENQPYQFFLTHGLLFGIGSSLVFMPALAILSHWFRDRRAFAIAVVSSGSSLGGVVYPIILKNLLPRVGFGWAVRISGFLNLFFAVIGFFTLRTRLPRIIDRRFTFKDIVDLEGFRHVNYCLTAFATFVIFYGQFIPYFYIESYGVSRHLPTNLTNYLVAIMNAAGMLRIFLGILADKIGILNVLVPCLGASGILILALWLPAESLGAIAAFTALYGLLSGAFLSMLPAYVNFISPPGKYGGRLGTVWFFAAVACLAGTPTAGAFVKDKNAPHFDGVIIFCGALVLTGTVTLAIARILQKRS